MSRIRNLILRHIVVVSGEPLFSINADDQLLIVVLCQTQIATAFIVCFQLILYGAFRGRLAVRLICITYKLYSYFLQIVIADRTVSVYKSCTYRGLKTTVWR